MASTTQKRQITPGGNSIAGQTTNGADGPVVFYTDGSVSRIRTHKKTGWMTGWGYLSTDGRYGCGRYPQFDGLVGDPAATTELRAIWHAVGQALTEHRVTVITDSAVAARTVLRWQDGDTTMPGGYTGSRRTTPTLELLRQAIAANPDRITVWNVKGHNGDVLNEAADTLAQLGMRWARDNLTTDDVERRAAGVAEGFLADYRQRCR
jgi:ribonuclease HI